MLCPMVQYQVYNHIALWLGDYKPDIALLALHNIIICMLCHSKSAIITEQEVIISPDIKQVSMT